jgi:tuftelin-interacting protein 11
MIPKDAEGCPSRSIVQVLVRYWYRRRVSKIRVQSTFPRYIVKARDIVPFDFAMPRRKRQFLEDGDSDSSVGSETGDVDVEGEDLDARAERALFENPYQHKRRRKNGSDDEDDDVGESTSARRWMKAPAFVSRSSGKLVNVEDEQELGEVKSDGESGDSQGKEDVESSNGETDSSEAAEPSGLTPDAQEEAEEAETEERPRRGGIGARSPVLNATSGIGASRSTAPDSPRAQEPLPSAFGAARAQRSFLREAGTSMRQNRPSPLPPAELAHFSKLQGTFGARMLAKMGWQTGTGLGVTGEGIITPIDQKQRPGKIGLAYRGFKEKTEQSKAEAKRRGEVLSDNETEAKSKKVGKKTEKEPRSDAWKKPSKKVKMKVEYKTYEEIMAEASQKPSLPNIGVIIDATGATVSVEVPSNRYMFNGHSKPREVSSLSEVSFSSWTPSTDPARIPEVRHNLRLIADACMSDLDGLAREAKALNERKKWIIDEDTRLRKKLEEEAERECNL